MPSWTEITAWRKARRAELIACREGFPATDRQRWNKRITELLITLLPVPRGAVVGLCWPYRREFDARFAMRHWREHDDAIAALPEVVAPRQPLRFRRWWPGVAMRAGVYGIPVPDGTEELVPDILIVPMNAFDDGGYRLGYGGGFFDRTLATHSPMPLAAGVSYEALHIPTIYPQPFDLKMDFIVTEKGVRMRHDGQLVLLDILDARAVVARLISQRGLPRART